MSYVEKRLVERLQDPEFKREWESLKQSLDEMQQIRKDDIKGKTWDEFVKELDEEERLYEE